MLPTGRPALSVVVPVYRSAECLVELASRVDKVCKTIGAGHELILVDDCSPDHSWQVIAELCAGELSVVGILLRKNVGQDNAIMAGFNAAQGSAVVVMDDDLQHAPEDIGALLTKLQEGYDVVYAKYRHTHQKLWKNLGSWFNGKVAQVVLGKPRDIYLSPYKIIASEVVAEIIRYRGPYPYVDGLLFRTTSNIGQVTVEHHARFRGEGSYTLWKSIGVWARLCTNFSVVPLRLATITGGLSAGGGLSAALGFVIYRLFNPSFAVAQEGWVSVIVSILVLGGVQLLTIGVLGEYVGQMHLNINSRPQYVQKARLSKQRSAGDASASDLYTECSTRAPREIGSSPSGARRAARDS